MRPLIRGVFVLSIFGILAAHVSVGALRGLLEGTAALSVLDGTLKTLLIAPFGREFAVYALLGAGALLAVWVYTASRMSQRQGRGHIHSTW